MQEDYHAIKWLNEYVATRKTREVDLKCGINRNEDGSWEIFLSGTADLEHHLLEDSAIFLKKICDKKCGEHSI